LTPTSSLQAAIDGHPGGTTFCLSAGVYHLAASVVPKSNDVLWGTSGTVLTGDGVTADGIVGISTYQQGVVIRALSAERFTDSAIILGNNWLVEDSEISYAGGLGLQLQDGATLRDDYFHHNGRRGFGGVDVHNVLVVGNEIAYNNTIHATDGSAGGAKVLMSDGVTFRNNYVHNNYFSGLHCDTDCINFTYEGNVIEGNTGKGLLYEKGYTATIRNNLIAGNDSLFAATTLNFGANLRLNTSMDVEVYGNVIEATVPGTNGISLADYDRGTGPLGTYALANDYVHDNVIRLLDGQSGLVGKTHDPTHANNRFVANHYYVPALSAQYFAWQAYPLTWKIWRSNGQDGTGTWSQG
jgi:hypothetical protein